MVFGVVMGCGVLAAGAASAEPYISASIGGSFRPVYRDILSSTTDPFGNSATVGGVQQIYPYQRQTRFQTGLDAEVAAGFRFKLGRGAIRTEVAVEYGQYYVQRVDGKASPTSVFATSYVGQAVLTHGGLDRHGDVTFNAFYDFPQIGPVIPYLGAGVGYHYGAREAAVFNGGDTTTSGGVTLYRRGLLLEPASETRAGTYLAEIGMAVPLSKNFAVIPAIRYSQLFDGKVPLTVGKVGVRYDFD